MFAGSRYPYKFRLEQVSLRPGTDVQAAQARLNRIIASVKGAQHLVFSPPAPLSEVREIQDVAFLPLLLSGFLALLALGAVGHALALAVRRRRQQIAVLRALGLTPRQARAVIGVQATVLAVTGLAFGIPLGLIVGRAFWREVAHTTPLAYHPPVAVLALLLITPVVLVAANLLAAWPARRAARLHTGSVLRAE
jgi:ABC-type antimicrobial peptide transport system permease subunit